jgi:TolB-like protein
MRVKNYTLLEVMYFSIFLMGCSSHVGSSVDTTNNEKKQKVENPIKIEKEQNVSSPLALQTLADKLVADVVNTIPVGANIDKVAIATPVDVSSLEKTDWLGRELAEYFVSALHQRGFPVLEYKIKGWLEITANGDYVYSRDWQKLASKAAVSRVLSGTMSRNDSGVMVYARIVNLKTLMVEGSAEIFIPYNVLPSCYKNYPVTCGDTVAVSSNLANSNKTSYTYVSDNYKTSNKKTTSQTNVKNNKPTATSSKPQVKTVSKNHNEPKVLNNNSRTTTTTNLTTTVADGSQVTSKGTQGIDCASCKGSGKSCHQKCSDPVIYPAGTRSFGSMLVRDVGAQSQFDRR